MGMLSNENKLYQDIKTLIEQGRQRAASAINAEISLLYWNVGKRIKTDILRDERAEYGKRVLDELSARLTQEYGKGWSIKQLWHCLKFVELFPDSKIVSALRRQLSWTSIKTIMYIDEPLKRDFLQKCVPWNIEKHEIRNDENAFGRYFR
jgi:hypothetical protein